MIKKVITLIFFPLLVACSQVEDKPIPTPTQYLSLADGYVAGLSELPSDHIIFILVKSENNGTGSCNFPVVEQAPLSFRFTAGILEIAGSSKWLSDKNLVPVQQKEIKCFGFFGYYSANDISLGGGVHNEIHYIYELPFKVTSLSFEIYSLLKDGTIVAGVEGTVYRFEPNQSWAGVSSHEIEGTSDCQVTNSFSITNYGLLNVRDVKFTDEILLP